MEKPRLANLLPSDDWTVSSRRPQRENRLRYLRYRPALPVAENARWLQSATERDADNDAASAFVDDITADGEEVLVLTQDHLITHHSFTEHVGGRYRYLFYLLKTGVLDRKSFFELVPHDVVERLLHAPPRIIVTAAGHVPPLLHALPELSRLAALYEPKARFGSILVLARRADAFAEGPFVQR
jgi:hypothetical protein